MASIGEALLIALDHHQSGRVADAETLYRRILEVEPGQADALHLLGVLRGQEGDGDAARGLIRRAITLDPGHRDYPVNLANTLLAFGHGAEAADSFAHALALDPANGEVAAKLAALRTRQGGNEARALIARVLAAAASAETLYDLGLAALERDWLDEAKALFGRVVRMAPDSVVAQANLALLLHRTGQVAQAERHYRLALMLRPAFAEMLRGLGLIAFGRRGADRTAGRQAAAWLGRAARIVPLDRDTAIHYAVLLLDQDRAPEVPALLVPLVRANPQDILARYNLALAMAEAGLPGALDHLRRLLALAPDLGEAMNALGAGLGSLGYAGEGLRWRLRACAAQPGRIDWWRNLLMALLYVPGLDAAERFELHRHLDRFGPPPAPAVHRNRPDPGRRLRVGYLTSDLRAFQPVSRNMLPLYEAHDRDRVAIHTYADVAKPDATTARFRALSDGWCAIEGMDDAAVAERIREDGIDVLVLLAGRFDRNRPLVCRHRPAPVQVSFLDAATSGLSAVDGIVTDRIMTPRHGTELFTERPLRLPSYYLAAIPADAPLVGPLPMLDDGLVRFGCFNNPTKISDGTLRLWAALLRRLPKARLLLKYMERYRNPLALGRIRDGLVAGGVDPAQVETRLEAMWDRVDTVPDHLAVYQRVDVALDPFPFSGSTTTFEALSMGVPVVALLQDTIVSRWSGSMLHAVGLGECVARSEAEYLDIAAGLAGDPARLAALRAGLRARLAASPLCDGRLRARQLERVYRALWRRWCRQQAGT
ncbi:tetratricopeptide repeat protein [Azospirillum thermophilum]|uniref:protein O-GlcNAc transferase n=1 Tax=Azospirillum thermophilum TaxID=2202148 RepID=A0A2S2CQL2_9PROT|nr:tetratricopeptide repeat protein [Azospirillum thermophilum]AWK86715.1 hypothetical protein DEW08_11105 [Azospirillum thermophilum]